MRRCILLAGVVLTASWSGAATTLVREKAGTIWQDGLFVGDGRTGALAYAPSGLEWTINRNDVFDSRCETCDYLPHDEMKDGRLVSYRLEKAAGAGEVRVTCPSDPEGTARIAR